MSAGSAAHDEIPPRRAQPLRQVLEGQQARGVDGGHVPQAQHHDRRLRIEMVHDGRDLVRGPEQEGPVHAVDSHVGRDVLVLQGVDEAFLDVVLGDPGHRRRRGHRA